jgi:hypothetical protein
VIPSGRPGAQGATVRRRHRLNLSTPLGRYGFTILAILALTTGQYLPGIACAGIAYYAWNTR